MKIGVTIKPNISRLKLVLLLAILSYHFHAFGGGSQLLDQEITIKLANVPFDVALKEIEAVAKVKFVYSLDQLNIKETVTLEASKQKLRDVLNNLLAPLHVKYKVHEKEFSISLKKETGAEGQSLSDPTIKSPVPGKINITGTVTDAAQKQPMPGVNILIKGTTAGTTTDGEGRFSLEAEGSDVLVFSFIGYAPQEVRVNNQTVIDVSLELDVKSLSEVVVHAGYWDVKPKEQTGNIFKVEAKDIEKQPMSNPLAALASRVPGLEVTQQTGVPGGAFKVRIRGTNSIANGNDPLYIIDGVPYTSTSMSFLETSGGILGNPSLAAGQGTSPLNNINPSDIESIEVLKDADATAIYGSRGSNGVILITTKKGSQGKTKVNFNFYSGGARVARQIDLLNSNQYLQMRKEAFLNDKVSPTTANARDLLLWDTTRYTNWQKELIGKTANSTDAQLSISGGEKLTQFSVGGGYHKETTVFPGDFSDQRASIHTSITNTSPNQKLKTIFSVNYANSNTNLLKQDLTSLALLLPPVAPKLYDDSGNLSWVNWSSSYENPLAYTKRQYVAETNNLIGNAAISYAILPQLHFKTSLGYTSTAMKAVTTSPISSQFPDPGAQNSSSFSNSTFQNWILEPQLNWKPVLEENKFDVLIGTTFLNQTTEGLAQTGYGFSSEALMKNLASAPNRTLGSNYYAQYRYHAVFGRVNYSLKGKYILNFTGRRDGSSRFGPGKQFAFFGAAGSAWIFSEEDFIKSALPFLSFGKLRVSYGSTGNDQLGDYQYLDTYSSSSGSYQGAIGLQPSRLNNPNFAWEISKKFESGLEFGVINNKISGSVSYYQNRSSNQLVGYPLASTTGFSSIQGNFPAIVQNSGVEFELTTANIERSYFSWKTSFNISIPRNKLVAFPNLSAFPAYSNTYVVGQPLGIRKLYHYTGVDPATGTYTFEDVNKDGTYNFEDRQSVRFVGQDFFGGLSNHLQYKGFQVDIQFQFVRQTGNDYFLNFDAPGLIGNVPALVMDRWKQSGDKASVQRFGQSGDPLTAYTRLVSGQQSVGDASFVRLKNLSISYSVSQTWMKKIHVENARLFIQAQNLLTFTKYRGLDPEVPGSSQLPPLQVITGGFHITL
ncbi:MAG: SusC/RagA family TonB-linked outer membrane protein [Bacteroidetes bacterium]|nr:SusC/RagA family TonB-linked outer membrane protein [Bacteroidota bacterium]